MFTDNIVVDGNTDGENQADTDCLGGATCDLIAPGTAAPSSGCADGSDDHVFVEGQVVGCDGSWATPGIASGAGLCADGWSVCSSQKAVASKGVTANMCDGCADGILPNKFYATLAGDSDCADDLEADVWGCGCDAPDADDVDNDECGVLQFALPDDGWLGWSAEKYNSDDGNGGVMCCST